MVVFIECALIFFIGAVSGWIMELFFRRAAHKKWVNPGFLSGPCLPLYGFGLLGLYAMSSIDLTFISNVYLQKVVLVLAITLAMTLLEYITGLIFIKGLKVKLWDYSTQKGNIQGIICPLFTVIWGAIGAAYNLLLHEPIKAVVAEFSVHLEFSFVVGILLGIFIIDNIHSFQVVAKIKKWATEHNVVVKYEQLKLNIRAARDKAAERASFLFPFRSPKAAMEDIGKFMSERMAESSVKFKKFVAEKKNEQTSQTDDEKN